MACALVVFLMSSFVWVLSFVGSEAYSSSSSSSSSSCVPVLKGGLGVVIDGNSRVGREQKTAIEMAVKDHFRHCSHHFALHFGDSRGNSAASTAIELISHKHVDAILGTLTQQEATFVSQLIHRHTGSSIPIISISPTSSVSEQAPSNFTPFFIQISASITYKMQSIAAIVGHFGWRKVITINEEGNHFSADYRATTLLSDALQAVDSSVDYHLAFPSVSSLLDPGLLMENELLKLKNMDVKVFVVMQASVEFAKIMFEKANLLGMMETQYVWIVSDQVGNVLDSLDFYVVKNMQGVVGLKTYFVDTNEHVREFGKRFRIKYSKEYPEEENSNPSLYALRAYDAVRVLANAAVKSEGKIDHAAELDNQILSSDFEGLSGRISFKNSLLKRKPVFQIVNVIGRSYKDAAFWSPGYGFVADVTELDGKEMRSGDEVVTGLHSIYWPGGELAVPKGWTMGSKERPLRIGVPAKGAFPQFVKVLFDPHLNRTVISGFSIDVFEAAVQHLPYHLYFEYIPFPGTYDEMLAAVHNKSLDGAVGDTEIMADRYVYAVFTQPYIDSGLKMVVTAEPSIKESEFIAFKAFTEKMWIRYGAMSFLTGAIIWLSEYAAGNTEFHGRHFLDLISSILWFSVSIMSFSYRERIENGASRLVLAAWIALVVVVAASFTAVLSTLMTVPRIQPSILDVDYLLKTNAPVGCNGNSFIDRYLINALDFKPENIRKINSIDEYPNAFNHGDIKAAFFVAPHAKVFLAKYCQGYATAERSYKLGGFGFVFQKGSPLATDFSEAILKVTQSGEVNKIEEKTLSDFPKCGNNRDDITLDDRPFSKLFLVLECCIGVALFVAIARLAKMHWYNNIRGAMATNRIYSWAAALILRGKIVGENVGQGVREIQLNANHNI
ncbi:glutamate receptor 2.7-like [Henckelia pumila]|uniref:glutamate receptor 2.7-like n=1 Tax=Henckelia pumila TaxID=405737 RepID=UPI003C6E8E92